jgi:hypothetical protein
MTNTEDHRPDPNAWDGFGTIAGSVEWLPADPPPADDGMRESIPHDPGGPYWAPALAALAALDDRDATGSALAAAIAGWCSNAGNRAAVDEARRPLVARIAKLDAQVMAADLLKSQATGEFMRAVRQLTDDRDAHRAARESAEARYDEVKAERDQARTFEAHIQNVADRWAATTHRVEAERDQLRRQLVEAERVIRDGELDERVIDGLADTARRLAEAAQDQSIRVSRAETERNSGAS